MAIFISYSTADEKYAEQLNQILTANHYETWFAPKNIGSSESFSVKIGKELTAHKSEDEMTRILEDADHLKISNFFILLLSGNSMKSKWVAKEVTMAASNDIPMLVLKIDHSVITPAFEFLLSDCQYVEAYRLNTAVIQTILEKLEEEMPMDRETVQEQLKKHRYTYEEIGIESIASGDPYFTEGETLKITLGKDVFYLAPPAECLEEEEVQEYLKDHTFQMTDTVFDTTLQEICSRIEVDHLYEMIEESRRKIFLQFLHQENGCYFNNHKYGISKISRFERTETMAELPVLRIEMFETDYFTHRVMKDVCKTLAKTNRRFIRSLDFNRINDTKILFTSLGVNLILSDSERNILLTSRSTNAAETYKRHSYSLSVVEGVSISDYDTFNRTVNVRYTALRGLQEELGVDESYLKLDSLKFYDLFVNPMNLEMGLSCSVEVKKEYHLEQDIIPLHGKDEQLEVSSKTIIDSRNLEQFIYNNEAALMPQSLYTLCVYMEAQGVFMLNRMRRSLIRDMTSVIAKDGSHGPCGDTYVWSDHYIAVIDGATPKGEMLWDGQKGDVYVSHLAADAIVNMNPDFSAEEAISYINQVIRSEYTKRGIDFKALMPAERLQCSLLLYSVNKHEIWSFGDCMLRINQRDFVNLKEGDQLLASLRAFCIQIERDRRGKDVTEQELSDFGRQMILPYLKEYISLANRKVPFGYDVLDGGDIIPSHVKIYSVQKDDTVVMASDGYPRLFDTFEETEEYLKKALELDPTCIDLLRGTKGIDKGNESYDDRTYVSFVVA
ncbi:MAG: toll/interleukin-1 receptor domain-containing protein [Solobacterium sp.]|nr:toll/interleukin-1 receptor domain-containing protein [Solobacterium sp.]